MEKPEISALADDITEVVDDRPELKTKDTGLIKLFIKAFIILLLYLLFDKAITSKILVTSDGSTKVIGIFYGQANKKSNDTILVNLGKENSLNSGITKTKDIAVESLPEQKPQPKLDHKPSPPPKPSKIELLSKLGLGSPIDKVVESLGAPNQKFNVELDKVQTGYLMAVWNGKPEIRLMFYKDKLISKITK